MFNSSKFIGQKLLFVWLGAFPVFKIFRIFANFEKVRESKDFPTAK